jgi:hypothetical protein
MKTSKYECQDIHYLLLLFKDGDKRRILPRLLFVQYSIGCLHRIQQVP